MQKNVVQWMSESVQVGVFRQRSSIVQMIQRFFFQRAIRSTEHVDVFLIFLGQFR